LVLQSFVIDGVSLTSFFVSGMFLLAFFEASKRELPAEYLLHGRGISSAVF
jgi:hypothetical protein